MDREGHGLGHLIKNRIKATGVIHMGMTQNNGLHLFEVYFQFLHIVEDAQFCVAGIKKNSMFILPPVDRLLKVPAIPGVRR